MENVGKPPEQAQIETPIRVTLCFRQGSFLREVRCESIAHAFARAGEFLCQDECWGFRIADEQGRVIREESDIRRTHWQLSRDEYRSGSAAED